jgi:argininosuccinate lyase
MAQLGVDISRLAEDLVLYATPEIRQIELPRDLSFTSSIMPQKRNPDVVELLRAKSALPAGALCHVITVLHSLPTSYNLDLQEITRDIWISSRTIQEEVNMLSLLLARAKASQADESPTYAALITATEMANLLVAEFRVPFRLAHRIVASAASRLSEDTGKATKSWLELVVQEARNKLGDRSQRLEGVLAGMATPKAVVASKRSVGSPRPAETARLLRRRITALRQVRSRQAARRGRIVAAQRRLRTEVRRVCS